VADEGEHDDALLKTGREFATKPARGGAVVLAVSPNGRAAVALRPSSKAGD
jgi:hypothetical protein